MTDKEWNELKEEIKQYEHFDEHDIDILRQSEELLAPYRTGPEDPFGTNSGRRMLEFKDDAEFVDVMQKLFAIGGKTCTPIMTEGDLTTLFYISGDEAD